jgi:hypothetical protein
VRLGLLTIDIDHIGDREMTRVFEHLAAAIAAVLIMTATFVPVVTVPPSEAVTADAPTLA